MKQIILLLLMAFGIFSCEQEDVDPRRLFNGNQQQFNASISLYNIGGGPISQADKNFMNLHFVGNGQSNLFSDFILESSHIQSYGGNSSYHTIDQGEFLMKSKSGEELFGVYNGFVFTQNGQLSISKSYRIQGGTGRYINAKGDLLLQGSQFHTCNSFLASISGIIELYDDLTQIQGNVGLKH